MTVQLKNYLNDLLQGGTNHETIESNIPSEQRDIVINQLSSGVLSLIPKKRTEKEDQGLSPLVLSCGIHGNETAPIEIVDDLLRDIASGKLPLSRPLLLIFGHIEAMLKQERFIDFNLNRLFSGVHTKYPDAMESPRAKELESLVENFFLQYGKGLHLDLHTAIRPSHLKRFAIYPTFENELPPSLDIEILKAMGIEALLLSNESASTFSAFSARVCGCQSYTLELGKVEPFGNNNREDFLKAQQTLECLIRGEEVIPGKTVLRIFHVVHEMIREDETYTFHVPEDYANFTPLKEGTLLESTSTKEFKAKENQAVVFPNSQVKIGQRSGLVVEEVEAI